MSVVPCAGSTTIAPMLDVSRDWGGGGGGGEGVIPLFSGRYLEVRAKTPNAIRAGRSHLGWKEPAIYHPNAISALVYRYRPLYPNGLAAAHGKVLSLLLNSLCA